MAYPVWRKMGRSVLPKKWNSKSCLTGIGRVRFPTKMKLLEKRGWFVRRQTRFFGMLICMPLTHAPSSTLSLQQKATRRSFFFEYPMFCHCTMSFLEFSVCFCVAVLFSFLGSSPKMRFCSCTSMSGRSSFVESICRRALWHSLWLFLFFPLLFARTWTTLTAPAFSNVETTP